MRATRPPSSALTRRGNLRGWPANRELVNLRGRPDCRPIMLGRLLGGLAKFTKQRREIDFAH